MWFLLSYEKKNQQGHLVAVVYIASTYDNSKQRCVQN